MIHDLVLKNTAGLLLGYAKIDITNDKVNVDQKQVNVMNIVFAPTEQEELKSLQEKIERNILPTNYLFKDLHDKFTSIEVEIEMEGVEFTTTTTVEETTTTTTVTP